ncbi:MAG: hypothetical protein R3F19_04760 [Verrucomicrobiales bacterium]
MNPNSRIESFVGSVRKRLNRHRAITAMLWAWTVGLAVTLVIAAVYILRGFAVPLQVFLVAGAVTMLTALVAAFLRRLSTQDAAHFVDGHYELRDAVISAREFSASGKVDGLHQLQIRSTEEAVEALDAQSVHYPVPARLIAVCAILACAALFSAFKKPSPDILQRLAMEEQTLKLTEEFNKQLEEELESLDKAIDDPEEREMLDAEKLRKWVEELTATKDQKEAMRQMANLEKKINRMANKLAQKKTEQLMEKVARELDQDRAHKELADKLKQQKYKEAGKDINKLAPKAKELSERKKELAKLKSAAQRMAAAARSSRASSRRPGSQANDTGKPEQQQSQELEEMLESLEQDVAAYEGELEELELSQMKGKLTEADLSKAQLSKGKIGDKLALLNMQLSKLGAAKALQKKLLALGKKLGQGQGWMAGRAQSPFAAPGGKEAGVGSSDSRRSETDELVDNGQTTELKGTKGNGPSLTKIEAAEDGTGVSHRQAEAKQRAYQRQYESFVSREDVPDDIKGAVKEYFTTIHERDGVTVGAESEPTAQP